MDGLVTDRCEKQDFDVLSPDEAIEVVDRYRRIVRPRRFCPTGWTDWHLEFTVGQFDCTSVNVNAVYTDRIGRTRAINLIHRERPNELQNELWAIQLEASIIDHPIPFPFDRFAELPLVSIPDDFIAQIELDLGNPAMKIYADALCALKNYNSDAYVG